MFSSIIRKNTVSFQSEGVHGNIAKIEKYDEGMCYPMLKGILKYEHHLLEKSISTGETVIDATCGNGNDTLFLSNIVGNEGRVFAFDIQKQAIENTRQLMINRGSDNVSLIHDSHAHTAKYLSKKLE